MNTGMYHFQPGFLIAFGLIVFPLIIAVAATLFWFVFNGGSRSPEQNGRHRGVATKAFKIGPGRATLLAVGLIPLSYINQWAIEAVYRAIHRHPNIDFLVASSFLLAFAEIWVAIFALRCVLEGNARRNDGSP